MRKTNEDKGRQRKTTEEQRKNKASKKKESKTSMEMYFGYGWGLKIQMQRVDWHVYYYSAPSRWHKGLDLCRFWDWLVFALVPGVIGVHGCYTLDLNDVMALWTILCSRRIKKFTCNWKWRGWMASVNNVSSIKYQCNNTCNTCNTCIRVYV